MSQKNGAIAGVVAPVMFGAVILVLTIAQYDFLIGLGWRPVGRRAVGRGSATAARIAWSLWAVTLALVAGAHVLALANRPSAPLYNYWVESTFIGPTFATLGALIVSRRPRNIIGWLFLVPSVASGMQFFSGQYATVALSEASRLPAGTYIAWLSTVL